MRLRRKHVFRLAVLVLFLFVLYGNRYNILRGMGNYLIREDEPEKADAIFVLSGNPLDRGREAAKLYREGYAKRVVCTGGEGAGTFVALGFKILTCNVTRKVLIDNGVDSTDIEILPVGTSTYEEFVAIRQYCKDHTLKKAMVVSSTFHTRRINSLFRKPLADDGVGLCVIGADESSFEESEWWKKEEGLLFLNNEYVKIVYYLLKY